MKRDICKNFERSSLRQGNNKLQSSFQVLTFGWLEEDAKNQNGIGKSLYAFKRNQRIHRGKGTTGNHLYKQSNLTWLTARSFQVGQF